MLTLHYTQKVPLTLKQSWDFFSSPENLKILTPEHLGFEVIIEHEKQKMYSGQIIAHVIRPIWNFPIEWITEITHVHEPHYFIDEQRFGPYKFWHHEHRFNPIPNGVEIVDLVHYKMPFGILGNLLHKIKVKQDLEAIFAYRHAKLEMLFGAYIEPES